MSFHVEEFKAGRRLSLDQVRDIQIDILRYFAQYCYEHKLRFFLAGGTLIGAVRHQGYVPWDDDVDIVMPRPDWEKFIGMNQVDFGPYEIRSYQYTPDIHPRPLFRIVDKRYFMKINHIQKYLPLWIDVLPLDGLPTVKKERKRHYAKAQRLKWLVARSYSNFYKEKRKMIRALKYLVCTPLRIIGPTYFVRKLDNLGKKYDYETAKYVGSFTAGYGYKESVRKSVFDTAIFTDFYGELYPIPAGYREVLTSVYKDFWRLPPVRKRKVHMLGAWVNILEVQEEDELSVNEDGTGLDEEESYTDNEETVVMKDLT